MGVTAILGGQWGDEGKGKIVDSLSEKCSVVARFQGGANAGHTVYVNDKKFILHQIPSGALRQSIQCILGSGMVVDPLSLTEEIEMLQKEGIDLTGRLWIARNLHLVTPLHKYIDRASETRLGERKIGTTGRGIGPAYVSKISRRSLRMADLCNMEYMREFLRQELALIITRGIVHQEFAEEIRDLNEKMLNSCHKIAPMVKDTVTLLNRWIEEGKEVLIEGAQGTLLDIDHGTFPFVTSSNTSAGGIAAGLGIPPKKVDRTIGIFKAYLTRVGSGPFPTEQKNETGEYLQKTGNEYGATTGRPRRCGWFDAVLARYTCMISGFDEIALTKLDVLNDLDKIKICVRYGNTEEEFPLNLDQVQPEYIELEGWKTSLEGCKSFSDLPEPARKYIKTLEELLNTPVTIISTGTKRGEIIQV